MPAALCEHDKPGTYVGLDLIPGYAEVGLSCVHGYMVDTVDRPDPVSSSAATNASAEPPASPEKEHAQPNFRLARLITAGTQDATRRASAA
jgi:hypothetical protein